MYCLFLISLNARQALDFFDAYYFFPQWPVHIQQNEVKKFSLALMLANLLPSLVSKCVLANLSYQLIALIVQKKQAVIHKKNKH